jgi:hypothetical protein
MQKYAPNAAAMAQIRKTTELDSGSSAPAVSECESAMGRSLNKA